MIIYNVTVKIDRESQPDWLKWMKEVHIPEVMATGCFLDYRMARLLEQDGTDGFTYTIQYRLRSMKDFEEYLKHYARLLQKKHSGRYAGKFASLRTFMEEI